MKALTIMLLCVFSLPSYPGELSLYFGLNTQHFQYPSPQLNEDNKFTALGYDTGVAVVALGTMTNSYYRPSTAFLAGLPWDYEMLSGSVGLYAATGYADTSVATYGDLLLAPYAQIAAEVFTVGKLSVKVSYSLTGTVGQTGVILSTNL